MMVAWVRGVLDRMRAQGVIDYPLFDLLRAEDGRDWSIWGGRSRNEEMPAFTRTRPASACPKVAGSGATGRGIDAVTAPQSWYARWTSRALDVPLDGGSLAKLLFDRLARDGVLTSTVSDSGVTAYQ